MFEDTEAEKKAKLERRNTKKIHPLARSNGAADDDFNDRFVEQTKQGVKRTSKATKLIKTEDLKKTKIITECDELPPKTSSTPDDEQPLPKTPTTSHFGKFLEIAVSTF